MILPQSLSCDGLELLLLCRLHAEHATQTAADWASARRARLGLYVFAQAKLFADCYELRPTMQLLTARPTSPAVLPDESYGVRLQPRLQQGTTCIHMCNGVRRSHAWAACQRRL